MKPLNREGMEQLIKDIEANERAKCEAKFKQTLYELDWAMILKNAIAMRTGSWNFPNITEWRNAGDTIMAALISRLKKQKVIT